jgi:hypothetical protein
MTLLGYPRVAALLIAATLVSGRLSEECFAFGGASQNQSVPSSTLETRLKQPVSDYELTAGSLVQALTRIAAQFKIPMGIVLQGSPEAEHGVNMSWHRVSVSEGLNLLIKSYPGYQLSKRGEVLHVYPAAIPVDEHNFLGATIRTFDASGGLMADNDKLREAVSHIVVPDAHSQFTQRVARAEQYRKFQAENSRVEDLLDKFVLATDDYKVWVVAYPSQVSLTKTGFRRTLSPFDFRPASDDEQPAWGIFLWGYDPVAHLFKFDWLNAASTGAANGSGR